MKCFKCEQTIEITKDNLIPRHRIPRGYRNQGLGKGGTQDLAVCPWSREEAVAMPRTIGAYTGLVAIPKRLLKSKVTT